MLYKKVKMLQAVFEKYNKQMKYLFNVFHIFIHSWLSDVGRASLKISLNRYQILKTNW